MTEIDYSVYLVTDSTMVPESSTFLKQVEDSVRGGATLVQLREKTLLTLDFIERAKKVHEITKKYRIPLIINDRVDVALAIDAEGVHVGQDDMPAHVVRRLIGVDKILGVTCSNPEEVEQVCRAGIADYVGLGTVYPTNTKKNVKNPTGTGPIGIRKMLHVLGKHNQDKSKAPIKCVAIGGINHSNAAKVLFQCNSAELGQNLDGLAIVSCIMANEDAYAATTQFFAAIKQPVPWPVDYSTTDSTIDFKDVGFSYVRRITPMVHHITNNVVKNFSANVTLAIGASPIMSELAAEFEEFATNTKHLALVLNLGTPDENFLKLAKHAVSVYNKHGKPIVFDPVAAGASKARLESCRQILNSGHVTVIKGNLGEIMAIYRLTPEYAENQSQQETLMRGVDSVATLSDNKIREMGKAVARNFKCIVVISGAMNYVLNSQICCTARGGSKLMGSITGTGCSLGSAIAALLSAGCSENKASFSLYEMVFNAVKLYSLAGFEAGKCEASACSASPGPGTFIASFLDILYFMSTAS